MLTYLTKGQTKILFLDFDGVLSSNARARQGIPYREFMPEVLQFLQHLVAQGIGVVVSSTWRFHHTDEELSKLLGIPIVGSTPRRHLDCRGKEIAAWLAENKADVYCIVDDDSDMLSNQRNYFVQVDHEHGLQRSEMACITQILGAPNREDWAEDTAHYLNTCSTCAVLFIGYKRRRTCKVCAAEETQSISSVGDFH